MLSATATATATATAATTTTATTINTVYRLALLSVAFVRTRHGSCCEPVCSELVCSEPVCSEPVRLSLVRPSLVCSSLVRSSPVRSSLVRPSLVRPSLVRPSLVRLLSTASEPERCIKVSSVPAPHCGSIRIVSLNRPHARNAISVKLLNELTAEVKGIHEEGGAGPTRALILASEVDESFCAGADLKERAGFTMEQTNDFLTGLRGTLAALSRLPIPTITALSSLAFGGGLELALSTHLRVLASTAVVALPETRLAIIPGAGGTYRLPALIGLSRARDLILTGRRVGGPEAYFLGLADRLVQVLPAEVGQAGVARARVLDEAVRLAREICEGAPAAVRAALAAVQGCAAGDEAENAWYERVVRTEDRDEALRAFGEKRKPVFKGR